MEDRRESENPFINMDQKSSKRDKKSTSSKRDSYDESPKFEFDVEKPSPRQTEFELPPPSKEETAAKSYAADMVDKMTAVARPK